MRRNPFYMGKIQEMFEKKKEIEAARKGFNIEDQLMKDADKEEKAAEKGVSKRGRKPTAQMQVGEEDLEEEGDDLDMELDAGSAVQRR